MGAWNWLDWTLTIIIAASVAGAVLKGFVRELISLASLVAGLGVALAGYRWAAPWFADLTPSTEIAQGAAFLALFVLVLILGAVISFVARKLIKAAGLQLFDRILGGFFGLMRGVGIAVVLLMVMMTFGIKPETVHRSVLAPYTANLAKPLAAIMPEDFRTQFQIGLDKLKKALIQQDKQGNK
jgi:membrane protein required for colicin V production